MLILGNAWDWKGAGRRDGARLPDRCIPVRMKELKR